MRSIFFLFICAMLAAGSAFAQPPSVDALLYSENLGSFDLSPSGRYVIITDGRDDPNKVIIKDLEDGSSTSLSMGDAKLNWAGWVTDDRMVVSLIIKEDILLPHGYYVVVGGTRVRTMPGVSLGRMIAINRDGSQRINMMSNANAKVKRNVNLSKIVSILPSDPDHILMPAREKALSLFKVNIHSGEAERIDKGKHNTFAWKTNRDGHPIARYDYSSNRKYIKIYVKNPGDEKWEKLTTVRKEDLDQYTSVADSEDPSIIYVSARPNGEDKAGLHKYNMATKTFTEKVSSHPAVDINNAIVDTAGTYFASSYYTDRLTYEFKDSMFQSHYDAVNRYFDNKVNVQLMQVSANEKSWIIFVKGPKEPGAYYSYNLEKRKVEFVAFLNQTIDTKKLGETEIMSYSASDGAEIQAFFTAAPKHFPGPRPLIIMPHGGPQERDYFGFDVMAQYFASRGYNIFQPNFRGSSGYGESFSQAGYKQWGGLMQDDITDGVKYLISNGKAELGNICIAGISYGGYAAIMGAINTPELYQCAVSVNGVTDLPEILKFDAKKFGKRSEVFEYLSTTIGDLKTDIDALQAASPIHNIEKMDLPLLLIHGDSDNIVPVGQSQTYYAALIKKEKPARFIQLPGVNHNLNGFNPNTQGKQDWYGGMKTTFKQMDIFFQAHLKN